MKGRMERKESRGEKKERGEGKQEKMRKKEKSHSGRDLPIYRHRLSPQGRITRTIYPLQISILMT